MLLAVFSDTHGRAEPMIRAVERCAPDLVLHLGDGARDAAALAAALPSQALRCIRGNCDPDSSIPEKLFFTLECVPVFMTHGHLYSVKYTWDPLRNAAGFLGARLVLFGHTHQALCREEEGILFLNPGSAGIGAEKSFALLELEAGVIRRRILPLPDAE